MKAPPEAEIARRPGRSHPPSLLRLAERLIGDERLIERGEVVLCACSGGPDSQALLAVLARLRRRFGFTLVAHGIDHGLRPEAASELAMAERLAASLGVPFATTKVSVAAGGNLQARAREARRGALRAAASLSRAPRIATGHTADDRAETFLLRLLRGAGPRGLAVLPAAAPLDAADAVDSNSDAESDAADLRAAKARGEQTAGAPTQSAGRSRNFQQKNPTKITLIRPLLLARRVDVAAHLARHAIDSARDPSNADPRFLRIRVRQELLPLLESLSPGIAEHLCALADMLAEQPVSAAVLPDLGRAQRLAVNRAKKCERPVNLRLSGGREVVVGFSGDEPVLMDVPSPRDL